MDQDQPDVNQPDPMDQPVIRAILETQERALDGFYDQASIDQYWG